MSDSDDNAFASADEGEQKTAPKMEAKQAPSQEKKIDKKPDADVAGCKGLKSPSKSEAAKGKGKQQQRNKKGKTSATAASQEIKGAKKQETKPSESQKHVEASHESVKTEKSSADRSAKNSESKMQENSSSSSQPAKSSVENLSGERGKNKDEGDQGSKKEDVKSTLETKPQVSNSITSPEEQKIAESDRDHHTPAQEKVLHKLEESANASSSGWGWSSWGSSLISAASNSVQTFTNQVGDGLTTIMDTVESSLGVPDPKSMAEENSEKDVKSSKTERSEQGNDKSENETLDLLEDKKTENKNTEEKAEDTGQKVTSQQAAPSSASNWFSSWGVGDLAKKMQDTGKSLAAKGQTLMTEGFDAVEHLAAGGIDVLENIGKKTYNTIAEHDPAFRRTRQFLSPRSNKPNLSQTLREARDQAEQQQKQEEAHQETLKAHFGTLFDDYQGIAHLEALEILSNQSEKKVHSLLNSLASEDLAAMKPQLLDIKNAFELDDSAEDAAGDQDFSSLVQQHLSELELGTAPDKLNTVHQMVQTWIQDFDSHDSNHTRGTKETHEKSIQALAELTAKGVEQFHKAGEMVLLDKDKDKDCIERAHSLARLTGVLCHEIGNLSNKFAACLNKLAEEKESEDVTSMVTNIYLEASNSSTYIQDAFLLLLPVLQHAALEQAILARTS
ncbi:protein FAM114A2-like [Elysia marginata]|uniref:Protein FAM114A2-like n=1 Tax=Elysia marginata TaxID=1093978 RepID=A0AAV4JZX6_9GAST|nr:protein FAM114A2-like [Elysia marginata]